LNVPGTTTVVFTDICGSTSAAAELGDDVYGAAFAAHVSRLREEVTKHHGRITKLLGDGVMALFDSAYNGVLAAVTIQQDVDWSVRRNDSRLRVRVGVAVGEVVDNDDELYGMALVMARRLCDTAGSGEILVSDLVRSLVGHRTDIEFQVIEDLDLKGIEGPTTAWRVPWLPRPDEQPLRVIVADDAPLIRAGVVRLLSDGGFAVTAEAGDGESLVAAVDADPPDLVVTDIRMPPTNTDEGLRAAAIIRSRHPEVAVLVLSQHVEARAAAALLESGSAGIGYLLKERVTELDELLDAARTVAAGGSVIDPIVGEQLMRRRRGDDALARLTGREQDVLRAMAAGKSNAAIASEFNLAAKTVESHVRSIFQKLDLEDNSEEHRRVLAVVRWLQRP
jgi:DNA-binding NarL/FixJ family response regulator/class 3 adenylate cyclase